MSEYQPHAPGEAPPKPVRDYRGVQSFAAAVDAECPRGMIFDPATGECLAPDSEQ